MYKFSHSLALIDDDLSDLLKTDCSIVYGKWANPADVQLKESGDYVVYENEWGIGLRMPKKGGLYFDVHKHPLGFENIEKEIEDYKWPDPIDAIRFKDLKQEAKKARDSGRLVVLMGLCPGIFEMSCWMRGFERFLTDLALEPLITKRLLNKLVELKSAYWKRALEEVGEYIDVINEVDDMASQNSMLFSPDTYRRVIKPCHKRLFDSIKTAAPHVKILFHSCGAVRPIISDLIEIGVDILNPVQFNAKDMDLCELKRDFGKDLCFWGGGIDTQQVLANGSPDEIRDHVRKNIEILAPGGGFIFSTVHIIQPNVPPKNIMIMWETLQEYGVK